MAANIPTLYTLTRRTQAEDPSTGLAEGLFASDSPDEKEKWRLSSFSFVSDDSFIKEPAPVFDRRSGLFESWKRGEVESTRIQV